MADGAPPGFGGYGGEAPPGFGGYEAGPLPGQSFQQAFQPPKRELAVVLAEVNTSLLWFAAFVAVVKAAPYAIKAFSKSS